VQQSQNLDFDFHACLLLHIHIQCLHWCIDWLWILYVTMTTAGKHGCSC
jgi:hypothetical protein